MKKNKQRNIISFFYDFIWRKLSIEKRHQVKGSTSYNRYPEVFSAVKQHIYSQSCGHINILSYGCSTGEECFSLREYFPNANIFGVDINRKNLFLAKKHNHDPGISFTYSCSEKISKHAPYNVIFCMSVLCLWPESMDLEDISCKYPFSKFENTLLYLDTVLAVGGLLVIYNSNFRFEDSQLCEKYEIIDTANIPDGLVHKFNRDNMKINSGTSAGVIFIKQR